VQEVPAGLAAALSDRYRLERELATGGMAVVYLARDLKHDRDVALKVLKADVAAAIGGDRFLAEIRTTARLKHPHILPLFDSGAAAGALFYVMPFVEGESLRARVRRSGALPLGEVVAILRQVADALAYAHAHGVIHRDVKADNVLVADGQAFLADFGVARAFAPVDPGATVTRTTAVLGTPAYMAPEQFVGGTVDQRVDLYAFGALAYELLTGAPPFSTISPEVAAAQLTQPPEEIAKRRRDVPPPLAALVMRCLEKSPASRPAQMQEVIAVLDGLGRRVAAEGARRRRRLWAAAAAVIVMAGVFWYRDARVDTGPALRAGRLTHVTTDAGLELDPALSPDGRMLAYVAGPPGHMRIFVRELAGGRAVPLLEAPSDVTQRWPQWSPDGAQLVFEAGRPSIISLKTLTAGLGGLFTTTPIGGSARSLPLPGVPGGQASSPTWSPDGTRLAFSDGEALYVMPADGQGPAKRVASGVDVHGPRWSPDGSRLAYVTDGSVFTFGADGLGNVGNTTLMVLTFATGDTVKLTDGNTLDTSPAWMPDSRTLLFISSRGGGRDVYSVRLAVNGQPDGEPRRLTSGASAHGISVARDGSLLLYSSYAPSANVWSIDIPGSGAASVADAQQVTFGNEKIEKLTVSKDGLWLAYDSDVNGTADVWKMRLAGGRPEQVTRGPNHKFVNDWSPDGSELVFHSMQPGGQRDLFVVSADGTHVERVTDGPAEEQHAGWSADGNAIVFDSTPHSGGGTQAFIVRRAQRGAPWSRPQQLTHNGSTDPKWSPRDPLIAFCIDGQLRVIAPDGSGERVLVDSRTDGGDPQYAVWSPDGQTIYYKSYDQERRSSIRGVPVGGGPSRLLVRFDLASRRSSRREFATDGRRFFFTVATDESDIWALELLKK
jgi:eukaryotic-like serine/threonine-protein kinase